MSDLDTVLHFLRRLAISHAELRAAFRDQFAPDGLWTNVGVAQTVGGDGALAFLDSFRESLPIDTIWVEVLHAAQQGAAVFVERVDHLLGADGRELKRVEAVGVFELEGGRIRAWRDYWDTSRLTPPAR